MKQSYLVGILGIVVAGLVSCSYAKESTYTPSKKNVVSDVSEVVILPELTTLNNEANTLVTRVDTFVEDPTIDSLEAVQAQWRATQSAWQRTEAFQFGPAKDDRIISKINYWPKRTDIIDEVLEDDTELTSEVISNFSALKKGLPVLEYLLFDHEEDATSIVSLFQSDARRCTYVGLLADDLAVNTESILTAWRSDGGNYVSELVASEDGLNMLVNQLIFTLENVRNMKLGTPMGKSSGTTSPEDVESQQSEYSLTNIANDIQSLDNVFNGKSDSYNGLGLDDYLVLTNFIALKDDINSQIQKVKDSITAIELPLWEAVDEDTENLTVLYDDLTELLRLVKVDMPTAINETVHFNDSDGD